MLRPTIALLLTATCLACAAPRPDLRWSVPEAGVTALYADAERLFELRHGPGEDEPALHPLSLPGGPPLTADRPADHPWHHGLWFAWKYVDGVNHWEHGPEGRPEGATSWNPPGLSIHEDGTAEVRMTLLYAGAGTTPLAELRRLVAHPPGPDGTWALDWTSTFFAQDEPVTLDRTPMPGEPDGKVWGGYGGLSLRLVQLEDRRLTSTEGPVTFSAQHRARPTGPAMDYAGRVSPDADPTGVALLDHPDNPRRPRAWYAIRSDAMSFLTPAVLAPAPLVVEPEDPLVLRWRLLVHPGAWDPARLASEHERYAAGLPPSP